jgi:hypothetical protein
MHLLETVFALLGAWMILSVPVALLMGRFLRMANQHRSDNNVQPSQRSFRSSAA